MSYCILRMEKMKSRGSLFRAAQHNTRERQPQNADPERKSQNWTEGGDVENVMSKYNSMLPEKIRKNAVHAVELVMTASPEFTGDWKKYLDSCDDWAKKLFGKENVLHVAHHHDETTPHSHILVIPLKAGKLNAKHYIGGSRDRMVDLQNEFFETVGKHHGLERGQSKSETKAQHSHPSLKYKGAALDEREKILEDATEEFKSVLKIPPAEIREMKKKIDYWKSRTPENLREIAKSLEMKKCKNIEEWEATKEKSQQQQQGFRR